MFPRCGVRYSIGHGTRDTDEPKNAGEIHSNVALMLRQANATAAALWRSENVYNMVYKSSEQGREYQGTLEDATARSLHHAGARSIGAVVSATRVRLPVVQRAPVDGRVDEIGAPLQQSASDAVRHHLGGQRERLQKLFPPPSIRIQVKASTCNQRSSEVIRGHQRSSEVIRGHPGQGLHLPGTNGQSGIIRVSFGTEVPRRSSTTSMPIHPIRRHQRQSDVLKGRTEEILNHVDAHPLAPTRRALDGASMLDGREPRP